jgi:hypothetical protein
MQTWEAKGCKDIIMVMIREEWIDDDDPGGKQKASGQRTKVGFGFLVMGSQGFDKIA